MILILAAMVLFQCSASSVSVTNPAVDPKVIPVATKPPEENRVYPIAVIGAGAGGTMAANRAVLNNNEVLLFAGANQERRRSRGNWVRKVDNVPGLARYERTVLELRNEVLSDLVQNPLGHNLYVIEDSVYLIEKEGDLFKLTDSSLRTYLVKYVVLATGMMDEQPHIQGSIRPILKYANGQTVAYCILCDGHKADGKKTAVIGHSESAAKITFLLSEKYRPSSMVLLTNGKALEASPELLRQMKERHITVLNSPILEVLGNEEQKQLRGFKLENGDVVDAEMGYVALGIRPNNQLALQLGAQVDEQGLVIADSNGETSVLNLFVIGDLRANSMKQIYVAWQHAVDVLQVINKRLREN